MVREDFKCNRCECVYSLEFKNTVSAKMVKSLSLKTGYICDECSGVDGFFNAKKKEDEENE